MFDINYVRNNVADFKRAIKQKNIQVDLDELLRLDEERRKTLQVVEQLRRERNVMSKATNAVAPADREEHLQNCRKLSDDLQLQATNLARIEVRWLELMLLLPSVPANDVPVGNGEADNVELRKWGDKPTFNFRTRDHIEIAQALRLAEFEQTRKFAGSRAYTLINFGVLLEMALMRFALDMLHSRGFELVAPPTLVRHHAMEGTGYFPLGRDDAYAIEEDELFLVGTAEVPLVALHANLLHAEAQLPKRFAGISTCYRREAGAAGRDTRGFYRVHQFQKVEQVVIAPANDEIARREHQLLLRNAEDILERLELPYRVMTLCTAEMGQVQVRKHDIETWMPSREAYCETHSCSTLNDVQARRLNIRYTAQNGERLYAYTLNNTAIASPRILIPFLENHQLADGSVRIPESLRPYLGGREKLAVGSDGKAEL